MAVTAAGLCLLGLDVLLRRLLFPVVLLSAIIFRYNLLSLVYLLLFFVSLFLPGPKLKSQKYSSVAFHVVVLLFSGLAAVGQALFQISIATDYNSVLCSGTELIWRQIGFTRFDIPAAHVVRLLLPDIIVFLGSLVTLCVNWFTARLCRNEGVSSGTNGGSGTGVSGEDIEDGDKETEAEPGTNEMGSVLSGTGEPAYPDTVQCYYQLPRLVSYLLDLVSFVLLMLSGVAVPSISSYLYYVTFLLMLIIWSLHLNLKVFLRTLRVIAMVYAAVHLVVLDLYQFQSAQELVPTEPLNTTQSLLARLFGLTPVIETDCNAPYALALHPDVHYTRFLSPAFILLLFVILCTDFRMWLFTPSLLWRMYGTYCVPIHDLAMSERVHCISKQGPLKRQGHWTSYGATGSNSPAATAHTTELDSPGIQSDDAPERKPKRRITWGVLWNKAVQFADVVWALLLRISFILSIIAMMAWSVLYPSWPSLVLLLWTCAIWLIPKINPRESLFYTSPLLVLYALVLLHVQYIYSLDLTRSELIRTIDIGPECPREVDLTCRTWVLFVKTLFTTVFFASFHEFVLLVKEKLKERRGHTPDHTLTTDGRESPTEDEETAAARAKVYKSLHRLVSTYWILAVLAAFLLVTLAGPPSLLKTVYMGFFFLFMISYQVTEKFWFYFSFIVWWLLIFYAALDLVLVYTYQFDVVSDAWERLYNSSTLATQNITAAELFDTIGLMKFEIQELRELAISLIPPAVFIAVLAMQLRYFTPKSPFATKIEEEATAIDLVSLFPQFVRTAIERLKEEEEEEAKDEETTDEHKEGEISLVLVSEDGGEPVTSRAPISRQTTTASDVSSTIHTTRLQSCYRFTLYAFRKTRQLLVELLNLFWRFLELHLHKVVALTLFAVSISQISALYWILLLTLLVVYPIPFLNFLTYPLLTLYLGGVSIAKMVYQTPLIKDRYLDFVSEEDICTATLVNVSRGAVYENITTDAAWIGFKKASNFANYVALPIVASLFMTLWFSARRYQTNYHRSKGIKVERYERGSLFLGVTKKEADRSILSALQYLINHFFEMYGVEVCWAMLAIAVAVRIDVYGVFYALVLGLLLFTPRSILSPVWLLYLLMHGMLLLIQYFFLLGAPPNVCYETLGMDTVYPWSDLNVTRPTAFKKWLFLPGDRVQILDKTLLYADFLVYLLVTLQIRYFTRNPIKQGTPDQTNGALTDYYKFKHWIDYCKVIVFQYSFWVSLFLMFLTAATRVSLFGLLFLFLGLLFLYRGQDMLSDKQRNRHRSWALLRLVTWVILLLRVSMQILDCVILGTEAKMTHCVVMLLFNAVCSKNQYFGAIPIDCPSGSKSVGLWVDALNFIVLTLQIIIFDTEYSEQVKTELERKEQNATFFRDVFDSKVEDQRALSHEERERQLQELKERTAHLTETQHKIDHILYAGVRIPDDMDLTLKTKDTTSGEDSESHFGISETMSISSDEPTTKHGPSPTEDEEREMNGLAQTWFLVKGFLLKLVDTFIGFLESSSVIYRSVVAEISAREPSSEPETSPFAQPTSSYGSTEASPDPDGTHKVDVPVEIHSETPGETGPSVGESDGATPKPVVFDVRGDTLVDELNLAPSSKEREEIESYEEELEDRVKRYSTRPRRLLTALYYMFLSHSDYLVFFLLILNIILNGSLLSLMYAVLMFSWGLLSIPWPTKRFWVTLTLYTMLVLVVKYGFQFYDLDTEFWSKHFDKTSGLYPPRIIGILHHENFFANAVWDVLLLIALLLHRSLLRQYGLWTNKKRATVSNVFFMIFASVRRFFQRLLSSDISQGTRDYYPSMLFFDVLCFLTIVFGVNSFGVGVQGSSQVAVAEFLRTNSVPLPFVIMLLLQFLSMLVDRAIYLRHSVLAKLVFQVVLLLAWHIWLFFLLPSSVVNARPFTENAAAQCIYFFKSCYFIVSSLQIAAGYPTRVLGYLFTRSYDIFSWLAFLVYRVIPLLPELREVTDWVFTDTTLSLFNWFKVQEIYAQLYLVKVQRERELDFPRYLGDKQTWLVKVFLGGLLVAALVLLIWGPLLVMSVISTSSQPNPPVEVSIRLTLSGYEPLVRMTAPQQSITVLNITEYRKLRAVFTDTPVFPVFEQEYLLGDFSRVSFPGVSSTTWAISPPSRCMLVEELRKTVNTTNTVPLVFSWSITRNPATGLASETVSGSTTQDLLYSRDNATIHSLLDVLNNTGSMELSNLYPSIIRAPSNDASKNFTELSIFFTGNHSSNVSCNISLDDQTASLPYTCNQTLSEWWGLQCDHELSNMSNSSLDLYIYSDRVAPALLSGIASIGIIGLYISVVLVIGRFIRTYISDLPTRLYIDEILNPDPLLKLCDDIFLVRESKDFQLEEILVGKLFFIFKSPEKVAKVTEVRPKLKTD